VAAADSTAVLAPDDITHPVQAVFNQPLATPPLEKLSGVGLLTRYAGDGVLDFTGVRFAAPNLTGQLTYASQARPIEMPSQACRNFELPAFAAAVPLVERFSSLEFSLPGAFVRRGKKRVRTRLRAPRASRPDCL